MKRKKYYGLLFSVLLFALAGCGGGEPEEVFIIIELSEYAYSPGEIELKVGQVVSITIINTGLLEHEIMFGKEVARLDGVAIGFAVDMFEFAGVEPGGLELVAPNQIPVSGDMDHDMDAMDDEESDMDAMDMDDMDDDDHDMDSMGDGDAHAGHSGYMTTVGLANTTKTITFTVTEEMVGVWQFGCFLVAGTHFAQGMKGTLTITN